MKKYLLLLLTMLTTTLGAWADGNGTFGTRTGGDETPLSTWNLSGGTLTITLNATDDLKQENWGYGNDSGTPWTNSEVNKVVFNMAPGVTSVNANILYLFSEVLPNAKTLDLSNLSVEQVAALNTVDNLGRNNVFPATGHITSVIVHNDQFSTFTPAGGSYNILSVLGSTLKAKLSSDANYPVDWTNAKGSSTELAVISGTQTNFSSVPFENFDFTALSPISSDITVPANSHVKVDSPADKGHIKGTDASNVEVYFDGNLTVAGDGIGTKITTALSPYGASLGDIVKLTVTGTLTSADVTWLNTSRSSLTVLATLDLTGVSSFGDGVTKENIRAAVPNTTTVLYPAPYTITNGCTVTINMDNVLDEDMSSILIEAVAAVKAGGQNNICTLIVNGNITNLDLAALADASMTDATRIDLSGATLASGATIENIRIPASLQQLVLPKDMTMSAGLATKLAAAANLWYAYSPSSDSQNPAPNQESSFDEAQNLIADYVWVNKAGGLAQAFTNETKLRNSYYIKVASSVALNTIDVNFDGLGASKPSNYLFLDLSASNLTTEVASSYVVTDDIGYRIILPDNWSNADMAIFAALPRTAEAGEPARGNLAAVYSYEGSKLNILVIENEAYNGTALQNPRIVRPGTNAIEILPGTYSTAGTPHPFKPYSTDHDGDGIAEGIISAINNAQASIKSVIINIANTANSVGHTYTFTNPNMTYLSLEGVKSGYGSNVGANLVISGANALETLNLKNGAFAYVTASGLTSLKTVDLTGTRIDTGAADFSNTPLETLTTTSSTDFVGALNLTSTALTSFSTSAKVTGNIYLNASSSLASVDLTSTQFQNNTSMIHIDSTEGESETALSNLKRTVDETAVKTIMVPNGFDSSTRIHPYADVQNNIQAQAASGAGGKDSDNCYISYDAATKTATAHINTAGHLADLLSTSYNSYPEGTTFKFASGSVINENDLKALAGYIATTGNSTTDMGWRSNYYYVDLYDLTASDALCKNATYYTSEDNEVIGGTKEVGDKKAAGGVIFETIDWLRANNRQFKGLILPKDHTLYGSGISLIQSEHANTAGELSTCSEFIAYYKTQEIKQGASEATPLTKTILFTHVYNQTATNSEGIQASNNKLTELLTAHGLNGAGASAADLYSVSTNGTTPFNATALVGNKGYIETFNNEMVGAPTKANIYAYPKQAGEYTTFVGSSSIGVTPTEVLKIAGTVSNDASAVATAFNTFTNGPRVLDLSEINPNDDTFLKGVLEELTNKEIEYIILPAGKSKELVCKTTYSASLTKLKAVISSSNTNLVAYVKQAGSLAEARYYATGGTSGTVFTPTPTGLTSVTLAGNLNASDIAANTTTHFVGSEGHWVDTGANEKSVALWSEQGTITTIDLKDAIFDTQTDMNFSYAGLSSLHDITLPTSESMTEIPAECFMGITTFDDLCIPYNYTHIGNRAFLNTYMSHLTTTDASGGLVDNGELTYTLSANIKEIGSKPEQADANGVYSLSEIVFPQNRGVTDVYVLAHKVPKCYANAFPANMLYGWGGFRGGDFPYCREKYDNSSDGSRIFTVLHFPDKASFARATVKEESYERMKALYTDVTKVYTKKEQTGAVDANGDPIVWPTFGELRRVYNQATDGIIWDNWKANYDINHEVNGGDQIGVGKDDVAAATEDGADQAGNHNPLITTSTLGYNFAYYEGWHQFTLSLATYVEPDILNAEERNFVQGKWYTFCIPFDMTEDQVYEMLGVPYSTAQYTNKVGETVIKKSSDASGEERILPEIHTLNSVERTPGSTNVIQFRMTDNLASEGEYYYLDIDNSGDVPVKTLKSCGTNASGEKIAIKGGYPYYIRPYLPQGTTINNLGKYVMSRFSDKFKQAASCANNVGTKEYLGSSGTNLATLWFAKPYEEHKIWAKYDDVDNTTDEYEYHDKKTGVKYYYTFIGQFWTQRLPKYCYYTMEGTGKWYRFNKDPYDDYKWHAYKCVILCTQEVEDEHATSGKFRDADRSHYPNVSTVGKQTDLLDSDFYLGFLNGLDDYEFSETSSARQCVFMFNDDIMDYGEGGQATAIDQLDGEYILPQSGKVYNMNGQLVGNSLDGLSKGMYIVNGKKVVIR